MIEPWTGRSDLEEYQMREREKLLNRSVADALAAFARQVKKGVPLEDIDLNEDEELARVYQYRTSFAELVLATGEAVRHCLIELRDK